MTTEAAAAEQAPQARTDRIPQQAGSARPTGPEAFTRWVEQRCAADPGVRAALRRGAGKPLDQVPSMHRFVARWLPTGASEDVQRAYCAVAAVIAAQRRSQYVVAGAEDAESPRTNRPARWSLGRSFAEAVESGGIREASAEARLNLLSRQSVDGLHRHLPGVVRQLREAGVRVDWSPLLVDLCRWRRRGGEVKRLWLQDFYRARHRAGLQAAMEADDTGGDVQQ
ncbi:type I-E CRISPR-associated protein Cse2/CasB [Kitasatospora sp. NPDC004614]|uniref:type I-E CRISPR-associated protein Cse2/CasB n=1 Tax=unclassified Kitasatospora TaxID=2633591 RepID=UPI0036A4B70C